MKFEPETFISLVHSVFYSSHLLLLEKYLCISVYSKIGLSASPQPSTKMSSGYGEQLSFEKDHLSMTLPSKPTAYKDKRLEMIKNEMDAMHRFK